MFIDQPYFVLPTEPYSATVFKYSILKLKSKFPGTVTEI
jgi:hypothetical protein